MPLQTGVPVWEGDTAFSFGLGWEMNAGASVNVGAVSMSLHTGTHVDAPFHFSPEGAGVDTLDLSAFVGAVAVVDATGQGIIERDVFAGVDFVRTPRVLVRTGAWTDLSRFPTAVPTLGEGVAAWLGDGGVRLFGIDLPSVDELDSKTLPNHHALAANGVYILESVDLRNVPVGEYILTALPLRLIGADASPVRAILTRGTGE
ncbi:MAG: cyclase family protein [Armatimonadetes bacterium]|nr:cyclase family protein [Armatimonadota bacterium]